MNARAFRRSAVAIAAFSATAIVLAGCAGGGNEEAGSEDGEVTLTVATFNDFGYTDELLQEYMDENPNVKIVHNRAAESGERSGDHERTAAVAIGADPCTSRGARIEPEHAETEADGRARQHEAGNDGDTDREDDC